MLKVIKIGNVTVTTQGESKRYEIALQEFMKAVEKEKIEYETNKKGTKAI